MRTILVTSHKGGVGKTTTLLSVASALRELGKQVLVVDCDPLQSVPASLGVVRDPEMGLEEAIRGIPDAIHHHAGTGIDWVGCSRSEFRAPGQIPAQLKLLCSRSHMADYDIVLADTPPVDETFLAGMFDWANEIILISRATSFAYQGLPAYLQRVDDWARRAGDHHFHGVVLTQAPACEDGPSWHRALSKRLPGRVAPDVIPHDPAVGRALMAGSTVVVDEPDSPAARALRALAASVAADNVPAVAAAS